MNNVKINQMREVKAHLSSGKRITPQQALKQFHCLRLASIIFRLRKQGMKIITGEGEMRGTRYANYYLDMF